MTLQSGTYNSKHSPPIPTSLIYEVIEEIPVYYKGYKSVLAGEKTLEDIMGYGELQLLLVNIIRDYFKGIFSEKYWVLAGEGGLHIDNKSNLATDIAFYPKSKISLQKATNKYINIAPTIVIEIDTKADPSILESMNYYTGKTQKLLDFGVEQVIWIYTDYKKVTVANNDEPWLTMNWSDQFKVLGHATSINTIIEKI